MKTVSGACHCGAITFEADLAAAITALACNCSICDKVGFQHVIVPLARFRLLTGAEDLTTYRFNTGIAKHTFCKHCGVKPYYTPRSNPDGISLNLRCLDQSALDDITIEPLDGRNWEASAARLAHLSKE